MHKLSAAEHADMRRIANWPRQIHYYVLLFAFCNNNNNVPRAPDTAAKLLITRTNFTAVLAYRERCRGLSGATMPQARLVNAHDVACAPPVAAADRS